MGLMDRGFIGRWRVGACALALLIAGPTPGGAQSLDVGDVHETYLRLLQLSGDAPIRSFSSRPLVDRADARSGDGDRGPWNRTHLTESWLSGDVLVRPVPPRLRMFVNTRHPDTGLDGAVWQGRGLTTAFDFGATVEWRGLRVAVAPSLIWTQNRAFELAPVTSTGQSEYGYPWRRIDLPQRFGPDAFSRVDPGQSELRLSGRGLSVGFGTRNLWWGPGIRSGLLMSNGAGGFPHAFMGTQGPRSIGIGTIEANWIWGRLSESDYFDIPVDTDERYITGLVVVYAPSFAHGLHLGASRVFYALVPEGGVSLGDRFLVFQGVRKERLQGDESPTGDDRRDQMVSFFGRWVLPESGFEAYVEWARNDHPLNFFDVVQEPEHSQGYTLGFQKAFSLAEGRRLALTTELTHLERAPTAQVRAHPVYYAHHLVLQGYTHRGQVLGAPVGPGGNQQFLGVDLYDTWGRVGVFAQRRVHDNDAYYVWAEDNGQRFDQHDVSLDVRAHGTLFVDDFELGGALTFTRQFNRYFFGPSVRNYNVQLSARWNPQ